MNNPRMNRILGYIGIMIGCVIWYRGFHYPTAEDPVNGHNPFLIIISIIILITTVMWFVMKVRCPYCHKMLYIKFHNLDVCPHCGKKINRKGEES